MPPLRQPATMSAMVEQHFVDMVVEASEGLVSTPGDPMHAVVLDRLRVSPIRGGGGRGPRCHAALEPLRDSGGGARAARRGGVQAKPGGAGRRGQGTHRGGDGPRHHRGGGRARGLGFRNAAGQCRRCASGRAAARQGHGFESHPKGHVSQSSPAALAADLRDAAAALASPVNEDTALALLAAVTACLPEHLTRVDTTELSGAAVTAVVTLLPKMAALESLRLTAASGCGLAGAVMYPLTRALHGLPRLGALALANNASDNVLRVLAQACPGTLEELDVSHSRAVTDRGLAALRPCANLRVLKLTRTSVSTTGAERALRDLPWLQTLGHVPDLGRAICEAASGDRDDGVGRREELQLRAYKSDRAPPLTALARHCPRVDDVSITVPEGGPYCRLPSLSALADAAPNLSRLKVCVDELTDGNDVAAELLDEADGAVGAATLAPSRRVVDSLTALQLSGTPLSAWDLWAVGRACPRLEELRLASTPPSASPRFHRTPHADRDPPLPADAFRRLRLFHAEDLLPEAELMVLSRGTALEEIGLYHWEPGASQMSLGDDALVEALRDNPLDQLRVFSADMVPFLGERALQRLLQCAQLRCVASLCTWGLLEPGRAEELQAELDARNLDVALIL